MRANSAHEAVVKLSTLPLLAGENIEHAVVIPTVAAGVDLVVHVGTDPDGRGECDRSERSRPRAEDGVMELVDALDGRDGHVVRASRRRFLCHGMPETPFSGPLGAGHRQHRAENAGSQPGGAGGGNLVDDGRP